MSTIDVDGASLDAEVHGNGPFVVQLHGLTSSRRANADAGLDLTRHLHEHTVIRYDARGHGASTGRPEPGDYGWETLADDLLAVLDRLAPGEAVHGVGPSMGTGTLLHAAVRDPGRFRSLTLTVPPTAWETRAAQSEAYLDSAELVERRGVQTFIRVGRVAARPPAVADQEVPVPDVAEELLPSVFRGASQTDLPEPDRLRTLSVPTLLLAWPGDPSHPLSTARALHDLLPLSELHLARDPDELSGWPHVLERFLTRQRAAGVTAREARR